MVVPPAVSEPVREGEVVGAFGHVHQLGVAALLEFLAQRTRQPFERALYRGLAWRGTAFGRAPQHDHTATGQQRARRVVEEPVQRVRLGAVCEARGVEHQRLDLFAALAGATPAARGQTGLVGHRHPLRQPLMSEGLCTHALEDAGQRGQQLRLSTTPNQHGALDRGLPGLVTLQGHGLGQTQRIDELGAHRRVGKVQVTVFHASLSNDLGRVREQCQRPGGTNVTPYRGHTRENSKGLKGSTPPPLRRWRWPRRDAGPKWPNPGGG